MLFYAGRSGCPQTYLFAPCRHSDTLVRIPLGVRYALISVDKYLATRRGHLAANVSHDIVHLKSRCCSCRFLFFLGRAGGQSDHTLTLAARCSPVDSKLCIHCGGSRESFRSRLADSDRWNYIETPKSSSKPNIPLRLLLNI